MTIERIWGVTQEAGLAGLGLTWTIVQGLLLWGVAGIGAALLLYLLLARLGWLDAPGGERRRWARVTAGLTLLLVAAPAAGGIGLVTQVRNKVTSLIVEQADKTGAVTGLGQLLLLPVLLVHNVRVELQVRTAASAPVTPPATSAPPQGGILSKERRRALLGKLLGGGAKPATPTGPDVSFLLQVKRSGLVGSLAKPLAAKAWQRSPLYQRLQQSAMTRLLVEAAIDHGFKAADGRIAFYTQLLEGLRAGDDGKLWLADAGRHIGERFLRLTFLPYVEAPFNAVRLKLILVAVAVPLLLLGIVRLALRRRAGRPAAAPPTDPAAR